MRECPGAVIVEAEKSHDRLSVTEVSVHVQVFRSRKIDHITLRVRLKAKG